MKILKHSYTDITGMANLTTKRSGLPADIWSEHKGIQRHVSHKFTPRVKIRGKGYEVSVTVEPYPIVQAASKKLTHSELKDVKICMEYIGRNHDLFLQHFYDESDEFDDEDLFNALRNRGEYR